MLKTSVRKSVSLSIVVIILLSSTLLAGCGTYVPAVYLDLSYLISSCELPEDEIPLDDLISMPPELFSDFPFTAGEFIDLLLAKLTGPESPCSNVPTDVAMFIKYSDGSTRLLPDDSTLDFLAATTEDVTLFFGPAPKNGEIVRLTLFGYVFDNGGSCVLWSLDGSRNANANEKCGGDVKLVCTVKLVDKSLKYSCKDGYEWLGNQIVTDPDWKSWAEQFASKNGRP
jgi:hypothetical protein